MHHRQIGPPSRLVQVEPNLLESREITNPKVRRPRLPSPPNSHQTTSAQQVVKPRPDKLPRHKRLDPVLTSQHASALPPHPGLLNSYAVQYILDVSATRITHPPLVVARPHRNGKHARLARGDTASRLAPLDHLLGGLFVERAVCPVLALLVQGDDIDRGREGSLRVGTLAVWVL